LTYRYTPPLLKKIIGKYIGTDDLYIEGELGLLELIGLVSSWAICVVESP
jgi:hypothetical protein